jgi:hypothetical protein
VHQSSWGVHEVATKRTPVIAGNSIDMTVVADTQQYQRRHEIQAHSYAYAIDNAPVLHIRIAPED